MKGNSQLAKKMLVEKMKDKKFGFFRPRSSKST